MAGQTQRPAMTSGSLSGIVDPQLSPSTRPVDDRRTLIEWAVSCALRVLPEFEAERPDDTRPKDALDGGMAWLRGETTIGPVRELAFDAHAAARGATGQAAVAAARSAGHAAAVAHMAGHARNAAKYALKSLEGHGSERVDDEAKWQRSTVPPELAGFVYPEDA